jgi:uncharacterized membrane protein YhaH (DUF805 family)
MPLTELLFSFKGRVQRLYWWVTTIAVGAAAGAITTILDVAAKSSGEAILNPETHQVEPTGILGIAALAVGMANLWINFALSVKRLHDRDRTGWWVVWQTLALFIAVIAIVVAVVVAKEESPSPELVTASYVVAGVFGVAAFVISIWLFIEIGFLRGTQGPNRYGPDPLGAAQADASI